MRIIKITLHGFKSYLEKTELTGFDSQFNAITGLNGSGKSNILDAICFALGQNAPSKFRVKSLAELVYKKGTGGITFAVVIIEFDLRHTQKRPSFNGAECAGDVLTIKREYHMHGNVSKITVNGHNSTLSALQNMFKSVQLNITNPHFLIMQGRVTKVLSMRAPEIWSMLEEAAGASLYRDRRAITLRTIKQQEEQLHTHSEAMRNNVEPKLAEITEAEANKRTLIGKENELKRVERLCKAISYYNQVNELERVCAESVVNEQIIADQTISLAELRRTHDQMLNEAREMDAAAVASSSTQLAALTVRARQTKKEVAEIRSRLGNKKKDLGEIAAELAEAREKINGRAADVVAAQNKLNELHAQRDELLARKSQLDADCAKAETDYLALQTGLNAENDAEGGQQSLGQQLEILQNKQPGVKNEIKVLTASMQDESARIKKLEHEQARLQRQPSDDAEVARFNVLNEELLESARSVQQLPEMATINEQLRVLQQRQQDLIGEQNETQTACRHAEGQSGQFTFRYTDHNGRAVVVSKPSEKIYGTIAQLTRIRAPSELANSSSVDGASDEARSFFCCALETALGGALHNVIVDEADTARYLLDRCTLARRTVFEPLDSVQSRGVLSDEQLREAHQLVGENNVWRAMDLIDFDEQYRAVEEKVLGRVWVCRTLQQANTIAYNQRTGYRAVTLDGETVNPGGEMTGGGRAGSKQSLVIVQKLHYLKVELNKISAERSNLAAAIAQCQAQILEHAEIRERAARADRNLRQYRLREAAGNRHIELTVEIGGLKNSFDAAQKELTDKSDELKAIVEAIARITEQIEAGDDQRQLEEAKKRWLNLDKQKGVAEKQWRSKEKAATDQNTLVEELNNDGGVNAKSISDLELKSEALRTEIETLTDECNAKVRQMKEAEGGIGEFEQHQRREAEKLGKIQQNLADVQSRVHILTKIFRNNEQKRGDLVAHQEVIRRTLRDMTIAFPWIETHKATFGQAGTEFSFFNVTETDLLAKQEALKRDIKALEQKTDRHDMRDATEAKNRYAEMKQKMERLEYDRQNLLHVLELLDNEKRMIMEKAIEQTNMFFGKIFGTLLPNATARLVRSKTTSDNNKPGKKNDAPVEGLEFQVEIGRGGRLNSLKELSGGQRSLVALSLILTLLKINPAPIYILDEIDAALDLSHTRNVGQMISKFFRQSQFIIVSLKQGMFTNANVLFNIFFRDGTSRFQRKVGGQEALAHGDNENEDEQDHGAATAARPRGKNAAALRE